MDLMQILLMAIVFVFFIIIGLAFAYWRMSSKDKTEKNTQHQENSTVANKSSSTATYTKLSVFDFMEFDKIEDNMIVQNNGARYLMGVECEGINYDLMSGVEKNSVEQGFIQFLNTLRFPIQIYTQTRTINIGSSIENYKKKIKCYR